MGALTARGLVKSYGKTVGIDGIDLDVAEGEFFVMLGPSGAGKTTTLKSVAGLVDIDAGEVSIAGRDMAGVEPYHRNVAMAFESYALYPQKTVFENLASPLRSGRSGSFSKADQQQRIQQVTSTLGIDQLLQRFPRELSNGQRQRTALGRVLVRPADVYLLDEPLSHLDAKLRAAMRAELKQLGEMSNTTTLYVTHDYQEALALGDRIGVLRAGRLVQVGTPAEIWADPVDTFVAKALGQPEINLVPAVVEDGRLRSAGGVIDVPAPTHLGLSAGDRVDIGIRPRDLRVVRDGAHPAGDDHLALSGRITLSERLGRIVELAVQVGGTEIIAVAPTDTTGPEGSSVDLRVPLRDVHLFRPSQDGEDTARIGPAAPRTPRTAAGGTAVPIQEGV